MLRRIRRTGHQKKRRGNDSSEGAENTAPERQHVPKIGNVEFPDRACDSTEKQYAQSREQAQHKDC